MALVLMATHGWGTLFIDPADLEAGVGLQSSFTNPADATAVTHYADDTGASPSTGPVTADANGRLMRWVEEGAYDQELPGGTVLEVQAVSGSTLASVEGSVADLDDTARKWFPVPTGADDAADAISRLNAGENELVLRRGNYLFQQAVTVPDDAEIRGIGYGSRIDANGNHYLFNFAANAGAGGGHRSRISGLHVNKPSTAQSSGGAFDFTNAGNNIYIDHVIVSNGLHTVFNIAPNVGGRGIYFLDHIRFNGSTGINTAFKLGTGNDLLTDVDIAHVWGTGATDSDVAVWVDILLGTDSIHFEHSLFITGTKGLRVGNSGSGTTVSGCRMTDVTIDGMSDIGAEFVLCREFDLDNCDIQFGATYAAVLRAAANCVHFNGGNIRGNGDTGVYISNGALYTAIEAMKILGNNQNNGGFNDGVTIEGNTDHFKVVNNTIGNAVVTGGHQKYGVRVATGNSDNYVIRGNDFPANETANLIDGGTGVVKDVGGNV